MKKYSTLKPLAFVGLLFSCGQAAVVSYETSYECAFLGSVTSANPHQNVEDPIEDLNRFFSSPIKLFLHRSYTDGEIVKNNACELSWTIKGETETRLSGTYLANHFPMQVLEPQPDWSDEEKGIIDMTFDAGVSIRAVWFNYYSIDFQIDLVLPDKGTTLCWVYAKCQNTFD